MSLTSIGPQSTFKGHLHQSLRAVTIEIKNSTIEIKNLSLLENAKIIPLHSTLELEGLRDPGSWNGWKISWSPAWHAMDNIPWFYWILCYVQT